MDEYRSEYEKCTKLIEPVFLKWASLIQRRWICLIYIGRLLV
jgi:hypothetical protein